MAYTIEAALKSGCFDEVHVSTDSEEYAEIARQYGAKVPFLRCPELAGDTVGSWDVVRMILEKYEKDYHMTFDTAALLQPTSPLRRETHIQEAYRLMDDKQAEFVVGVCEAEHSPLWMNTLPEDLCLDQFIDLNKLSTYRQGLPGYYRINGAMYIGKVKYLLKNTNYYGKQSYAYRMDKISSVDIDDIVDFDFAEYLLNKKW